MKTCYIVGAGEFCDTFEVKEGDFIISADGGYKHLLSIGVTPDLFVGDADSLGYVPEGIDSVIHPTHKDETDMHLAYLEGKKRGYKKFAIYGGTGGRIDHTIANFSLLSFAKKEGDDIELCGTGWGALVLCGESRTLVGRCGATVSVFAYGGDAVGVDIKGLEYEAEGVTLSPSFPLGVSNSFLSGEATVSVKSGELLVIYEK